MRDLGRLAFPPLLASLCSTALAPAARTGPGDAVNARLVGRWIPGD